MKKLLASIAIVVVLTAPAMASVVDLEKIARFQDTVITCTKLRIITDSKEDIMLFTDAMALNNAMIKDLTEEEKEKLSKIAIAMLGTDYEQFCRENKPDLENIIAKAREQFPEYIATFRKVLENKVARMMRRQRGEEEAAPPICIGPRGLHPWDCEDLKK